ncbi:DOMON-like domain-containing protein [Novosphingopyxis sp.]|uniref:DOMON-like domain-containing protein n=1 Tax=Novosphingopyxis sp. TaxID=2709690 RepID=UPI003B5A7D19
MPLDQLELPDPAEPERADDLWQTTCFELFMRRPGDRAYAEFNFSPSSRWAAYRFDDVREGRAQLDVQFVPGGGNDASDSHFALEATLVLPPEWRDIALDIAISAVIEQVDGSKSYWALGHPADRPDFHHPGSFTLRLSAP